MYHTKTNVHVTAFPDIFFATARRQQEKLTQVLLVRTLHYTRKNI